jgi:hypothetical protein
LIVYPAGTVNNDAAGSAREIFVSTYSTSPVRGSRWSDRSNTFKAGDSQRSSMISMGRSFPT